jgi:hypothetical protein
LRSDEKKKKKSGREVSELLFIFIVSVGESETFKSCRSTRSIVLEAHLTKRRATSASERDHCGQTVSVAPAQFHLARSLLLLLLLSLLFSFYASAELNCAARNKSENKPQTRTTTTNCDFKREAPQRFD